PPPTSPPFPYTTLFRSRLAELGLGRGVEVHVKRLRVHGQAREQHVVGFGDGAAGLMLEHLAHRELFEELAGHGRASDQQAGRFRTRGSILRVRSWPSPVLPRSLPRSAMTRPRRMVMTGQPVTCQPSQGL